MNWTFGTGCLAFLVRAFVKAFKGVVQKLCTFEAKYIARMMIAAVHVYHRSHGIAFPVYSGTFISHDRQIIRQCVYQNKKAIHIVIAIALFW